MRNERLEPTHVKLQSPTPHFSYPAAGWLETFLPSALKSEMIGVLMPTWAEKNPAAASVWSKTIPVLAKE